MDGLRWLLALGATFGTTRDLAALVDEVLDALNAHDAGLRDSVHALARELAAERWFSQTVELARVARGLSDIGSLERELCVAILRSFAGLVDGMHDQSSAELSNQQGPSEVLAAAAQAANLSSGADGSDTALLESIVASAAQATGARYGSLFLLDEDARELVFAVSLREGAEKLQRFRLPLGRGIAGLVAATGQPIAVSDVSRDTRHAAEIAEQTGYTPTNLMCVPLLSGERVIGVLELMDKPVDGGFSLDDMQVLGSFAHRAAETIERSSLQHAVVNLIVGALRGSDHASGTDDATFRHALEVGRMALRIAERSSEVGSACIDVLRGVANYAHARSAESSGRYA
jgi:GAF domain-containing protein